MQIVTRKLLLLGLGLFALLVLMAHVPRPSSSVEVDRCFQGPLLAARDHATCYAAMIEDTRVPVAPFAFRPVTPWIAEHLPFDAIESLVLVTCATGAAAAVALMSWVTEMLGRRAGCIALGLFALGPAQLLVREPVRVDGMSMLLAVLVMWAAWRRRWLTAAVLIAFAVANHEMLGLLLVPVCLLARPELGRRCFAIAVPAVATFGVLRWTPLLYGHTVEGFPFLSLDNVRFAVGYRIDTDGSIPAALLVTGLAPLGAAWVFAIAGWRNAPSFLRTAAVYVPASFVLLLVAADWDRVLTMTFVVVIPLACCALKGGGVATRRGANDGVGLWSGCQVSDQRQLSPRGSRH